MLSHVYQVKCVLKNEKGEEPHKLFYGKLVNLHFR